MKVSNKAVLVISFVFVTLGLSNTAFAATGLNLGMAGNFAVLGGSTITNTGATVVNGDLGLNPGTSVTGFPPGTINGTQHITDAVAAQGQADLVTAYTTASAQTGAVTVSGDLGGKTLVPGVYNSASSLGITGTVTLDAQGNPNATFIFQIGSTLTTAPGSRVVLANGAQACNVFWQVSTSATLGTNSNFAGSILALSSVTATTGTVINGRVLARNGAVTLDANSITKPTCSAPAVVPVTTLPTSTPASTSTSTPTSTPVILPSPAPGLLMMPTPVPSPSSSVAPTLPSAGIAPNHHVVPWNTIIPMGILAALSFFYLVKKANYSTK